MNKVKPSNMGHEQKRIFTPDDQMLRRGSPLGTQIETQIQTRKSQPILGLFYDGRSVDLSRADPFRIARLDNSNVTILKMSFSSLLTCPKEFLKLNTLKELDLSNNSITDLNWISPTFQGLKKLDVSQNCIMSVPPEFKKHLKTLLELNLSNNYLKEMMCQVPTLSHLNIVANPIVTVCQCLAKIKHLESEWSSYLSKDKTDCVQIQFQNKLKGQQNLEKLLVEACQKNHLGMVTALIQIKPNLIATKVSLTKSGVQSIESLVQYCYKRSHLRPYKILVECGALSHPSNGILDNSNMSQLLKLSIERLDFENFNKLINMGVEICSTDEEGNTFLHILFEKFDVERVLSSSIAKKLLFYGVQPNNINMNKQTCLHLALKKNQTGAIRWAFEYNRVNVPKFDFTIPDGEGNTLLHLAAFEGNERVLSMGEELGISVFQENKYGILPKRMAPNQRNVQKILRKQEKVEILKHFRATNKNLKSVSLMHQSSNPMRKKNKKSQSITIKYEIVDPTVMSQLSTESRKVPVFNNFNSSKPIQMNPFLNREESEPSEEQMDEIPSSIGNNFQLSLQVPISCEKQSLQQIYSTKNRIDVWKRILTNQDMIGFLQNASQADWEPFLMVILNFLLFSSHNFELKTYDMHFLEIIRFIGLGPVESSAFTANNLKILQQFTEKVFVDAQKVITLLSSQMNFLILQTKHPLQIITDISYDLLKLHPQLQYDIYNPFPSQDLFRHLTKMLTIIQNSCGNLKTPRLHSRINRLTIIDYEGAQNCAIICSQKRRSEPPRKRIFFEQPLVHAKVPNRTSSVQSTLVQKQHFL